MTSGKKDFIITPWEVKGEIDYEKLIKKFGTSKITPELLEKIKKHSKELHVFLKRGIFYCHRDLDLLLKEHEKGTDFVLYTGRGPSGHTHIGHLMPWLFTKYLQDTFKVKLLFQLTDDEKFLFNEELSLEDTQRYAYENILDIIAVGFDENRTEIFVDTEYIKTLYRLSLKVAKKVNFSTAKAVFGFTNSTNIGSIFFTSIQSAPALLESERRKKKVNVLIPCAIDQDAHFRVTRDVAEQLGYPKPALILSKLFPSLQGGDKMSASRPETSIFTTDTSEAARKKIMNAFTGGQATIEEQKKKGGNPDICPVYQYLLYLFEEDDKKLQEQYIACRQGTLMCGGHKKYLADRVLKFLEEHQKKREKARDKVEKFVVRD